MSLIELDGEQRSYYLSKILEIENHSRYPIGDDFFKIEHGSNYFEFFNRLGKYHYYAWIEHNQLLAVVCLVLRQVPFLLQTKRTPVGYLCDLKVHPDYRGKNMVLKMIRQMIRMNNSRCNMGYAVSMNHSGTGKNRMEQLLHYFRLIPIESVPLSLWSLDAKGIALAHPIIEKHRGPTHYSSLQNIKEIVLTSTHKTMPLLHAQFGPMADLENMSIPDDQATYMFCSPSNDQLTKDLISKGFEPSSTATILAHQMPTNDWKWILTSEI